jgi:hypothetical protein
MGIKQLLKLALLAVVVFASGLLGGLAAFYYLAGDPAALGIPVNQGPMVVTQKQETIVRENEAIVDAIAKISGIVVNVRIAGAKIAQTSGSGVIITSDGLAAVPYGLYPPGAQVELSVGGKKASYTVLKRDKAGNVVILKLDGSNWPTAGFATVEDVKLGQRVFMVGTLSPAADFANEGIIRSITADSIGTTIVEASVAAGSPVFDIEGNIIGIATVGSDGFVGVIPVAKIKEIAGL